MAWSPSLSCTIAVATAVGVVISEKFSAKWEAREREVGPRFRGCSNTVSKRRVVTGIIIVTPGIIGSRPGPPAVLCIIRIILYYVLIRIIFNTVAAVTSNGSGYV